MCIRDRAARATSYPTHAWLRRGLVVGQIAISMSLLIGAALLLRSFSNLENQPTGMQTEGVLAAHISLPGYRFTTAQQQMEFFLRAEAALRQLPGVQAVGMSDSLPPGGIHGQQIFSIMAIAGKPYKPGGTGGMVTWRWVTPEYFTALDIPIARGQGFTQDQRTQNERFLVLSSLLASRMFGNENPIGQHVQPVPNGPWYTVLGVAANVKNAGLAGEDEPEFYRLRRSLAEDWNVSCVIVLKTSGSDVYKRQRLISGEGLRLIVLGGVAGLGAALATAQLLKSLLYNVGPRDPAIYGAVALLLALVAFVATLIPARAAMRVEPAEALRYE